MPSIMLSVNQFALATVGTGVDMAGAAAGAGVGVAGLGAAGVACTLKLNEPMLAPPTLQASYQEPICVLSIVPEVDQLPLLFVVPMTVFALAPLTPPATDTWALGCAF
jgi:hypothetical protein